MSMEKLELYFTTALLSLPWLILVGIMLRGGEINIKFGKKKGDKN